MKNKGVGTTAPLGALDIDGDVYLSSVGSNIYSEGSANSSLDMGVMMLPG